jgi:hypothetical protein
MDERSAIDRLSGLLLAGVVVAIFAVGLARGQDDWHSVLVLVGALLQVAAVLYATRRIWLGSLMSAVRRRPRELEVQNPVPLPEGDRQGLTRMFSLTEEEALVAGGLAIAGVILTLAGNLVS